MVVLGLVWGFGGYSRIVVVLIVFVFIKYFGYEYISIDICVGV